jgi:hypothetical protein
MSDKADLLSKRSVGHPNLVSGREYYDVSVIMSSLLFGSRRGHLDPLIRTVRLIVKAHTALVFWRSRS